MVFSTGQASSLPFVKLTDEQGLIGNEVITTMQDSRGYLWIGTSVGLSRFDGYQYTNFRPDPENPNSLSGDKIWALFEDDQGIIWIGTEFGGLNRYDPATGIFSVYEHDPRDSKSLSHNYVRKIISAGEDKLWVATSGGGLNLFDVASGEFTRFMHDPADETSLVNNFIRALQVDKKGGLWVGTRFSGLDYLNPERTQFTHYNLDTDATMISNMIQALVLNEEANQLWVGTWDKGLSVFNLSSRQWQHWHQDEANQSENFPKSIVSLVLTEQQELWIGSVNEGLFSFDTLEQTFANYQYRSYDRHSIAEGAIYSLMRDRNGIVWIGTWGGGVALVNPKAKFFKRLQHQPTSTQSIKPGPVEGIVVDKKGAIWIGIEGGGLSHVSASLNQIESFREGTEIGQLSSDDIEVVYQDPTDDDLLWIGTRFGGLDLFNKTTRSFSRYLGTFPDKPTLSGFDVRAILRDDSDNLWVGTTNGLDVINLKQQTIRRYQPERNNPNSISAEGIRAIFQDSRGYIWIGTNSGGLNRWMGEEEGFRIYQYQSQKPGALSHNSVWDIAEDKQKNLWVSTSRGINFLSREQIDNPVVSFEHFGEEKFVSLLFDNKNNLWVSAQSGIYQFNIKTKEFKLFNFIDGVLARHSYPTKHEDLQGNFYFGGYDGVTIFNPQNVSRLDIESTVTFTELSLYDRVIKFSDGQEVLSDRIESNPNIKIPYSVPAFSLKFSAFDYTNKAGTDFRYRLRGFDSGWRQTKHNQLTYTNLDPGTYLLEVAALSKDGQWQQQPTQLAVTVTRPPWLSYWAYLIYLVVFVVLFKIYLRAQRRKVAYKALRELSLTDQLTGLKNRHFVEQHIQQDIGFSHSHYYENGKKRDLRTGSKVDLIFYLIDIDNFKQVNDRHGHKAGDFVLVEMKAILEKVFRHSDYLIRWGGEEFLVIARYSKREFAAKIAERLRKEVASHDFMLTKNKQIYVTCSIGFIPYPLLTEQPLNLSWERALELADHCLYAAKRSGRNTWIGMQSIDISVEDFNFKELKSNTSYFVNSNQLKIETLLEDDKDIDWPKANG